MISPADHVVDSGTAAARETLTDSPLEIIVRLCVSDLLLKVCILVIQNLACHT